MYSRVLESSSSVPAAAGPHRRYMTDETTKDAINFVKLCVENEVPGLENIREFKELAVAIVSRYPSLLDGNHECIRCGELFPNSESHAKHVRDKHVDRTRGNMCTICQKVFNSPQNLQAHKSRDHSSLSDIKFCPFCNLEVLESIHTHNKSIHPFACFPCRTDFQSARERALHEGAIHNRKFTCPSCYRTFTERNHLTQHQIDAHSVVCRACTPNKSFTSSQALEAHYNVKHSPVY